jgi:peptide/nickel transport system permease protein
MIPARWQSWLVDGAPDSTAQARAGRIYGTLRSLVASPPAAAGLIVAVLLAAVAAAAPALAPFDPMAQDLALRLAPPDVVHWLGTDALGRDILSRLVYGARTTLVVVALVAATVPPVGLLIGCLAGYCGGWADAALMRFTDVFLAFPRLILALALVAALGPGIDHAVLALALAAWPPYARLARAETLALRGRDFIAAARLAGASPARLLLRHIAPLCLPSLVVRASLDMAGVILAAAGLGFLGLGAAPGTPEWGAMIAAGRPYMLDQWWVAAAPGAAIAVVSLGFNLLGDGLRDVLDPRQR